SLSHVSSLVFFHGINVGQTREVEIDEGKTLIVKLVEMSRTDDDGYVTLAFEVNGNRREVKIYDKDSKKTADNAYTQLADPNNELEIGSSIPGTILKVLVHVGDEIKSGDPLAVVEAMKMETNIVSPVNGKVESVTVKDGEMVEAGQLLLRLE
ncbi:biotin/lipoyl-containing protein, partial [Miniphocaeibacter sp.]|uniref:biotin/lipoyl-containing protein n=1 Tax=Miniphocaeibacter sp. TaxID=3100973 RepID=UPI003BAE5992